jgi:hypothetical protein
MRAACRRESNEPLVAEPAFRRKATEGLRHCSNGCNSSNVVATSVFS